MLTGVFGVQLRPIMAFRLSRRAFLAAPWPFLVAPRAISAAVPARQPLDFMVEVGILFEMITFSLKGTLTKEIDPTAGRYRVTMSGEGDKISVHTEASGVIRQGRFMPAELHSVSTIRGRESKVDLVYDHERGTVEYHSVTHTFFLGRRRQVDDLLKLPPGRPVDDLLSAELNFAANTLDREPDGTYSTYIVRRTRPENEGPDDVSPSGYRAELVPLRFQVAPDEVPGGLRALIDITGFSSWARRNQPARVTFGSDRHLTSVQSKLMLGTSFKARLATGV
ncbi:MAG TPA: hypothetical protein VMT97_14665 [Terriglobales bacterium]|nr:hypothetical protein [Terriglobales bacterium]